MHNSRPKPYLLYAIYATSTTTITLLLKITSNADNAISGCAQDANSVTKTAKIYYLQLSEINN